MDKIQPPAAARRGPISALRRFLHQEAAGGLVLLLGALLALLIANSPWANHYHAFKAARLGPLSVEYWINDGLMALFFLLVGLEIKRALLDGELSSWKSRLMPGAAALAGMLFPALIYVGLNHHHAVALRGWAIPTATDIAFALGVLALLGKRVPSSLKILLTAIAILDDLGAILIIAFFYTSQIAWLPLSAAALGLALLAFLNRRNVHALTPYLLIGLGIWVAILLSGVHATLAGVAVAMAIPLKRSKGAPDAKDSTLHRLEHSLSPWVAFAIVPLFSFANAGVPLSGLSFADLHAPLPLGIALGLFFGKQIGIFAALALLIKMRWAPMPRDANWTMLYGLALLCGIGFTMSLFVGQLAYGAHPHLMDEVRLGVLGGSLLSAITGYALLRGCRRA